MSISEHVETYVNIESGPEARTAALTALIGALSDARTTLQEIVTALGPVLTNTKEFPRSRGGTLEDGLLDFFLALDSEFVGTLLLAELLGQYTAWRLPPQSIQYLSQFFSDRLQDYPCQAEVLKGIKALLSNQGVQSGDDHTIVRAIFSEVHVQSMSQPVRKTCYEIFGVLLDRYLSSTRLLKADFVFGFIQAMDGEKDPRNLLLCFKIASKIVQTIPEFVRFDEDLFEVTSCYFPITFQEKPGDPEAISKKDLVEALRDVISSTPVFAPYAVPFLLEKIESTNPATKVDVLLTLSQSVQRYGGVTSAAFVNDLWAVIRSEVMTGTNAQSNEAALTLLRSLVKALDNAPAPQDPSSGLSKLNELALQQCLQQLRHYDSKLSLMAVTILRVISHASSYSAGLVVAKAFPIAFDQYASTVPQGFTERDEASSKRHLLVKIFIELIIASQHYPTSIQPHPLQEHVARLFEVITTTIRADATTNDEKVDAVSGLAHLALIANGALLNNEQREIAMGLFSALASGSLAKQTNVILAAGKALELIGIVHLDLVVKIALPKLFNLLKSSASGKLSETTLSILTDLAKLQPTLFEQILLHLVSIITPSASANNVDRMDVEKDDDIMVIEPALESLIEPILTALEAVLKVKTAEKVNAQGSEWSKVAHVPGEILVKLLQISNSSNLGEGEIIIFSRLLPNLASAMVLQVPADLQLALLKSVSDLLVPTFQQRKSSIAIFAGVIRAMNKSVALPDLGQVFDLFHKALQDSSSLSQESQLVLCEALGSIVNKTADETFIDKVLQVFAKELQNVANGSLSLDSRAISAKIATWIAKALVTRNHGKAIQVWKELQDQLQLAPLDSAILVSNELRVLFEDSVFFSNSRLIYKQKFFNLNLPLLIASLKDKSLGRESVYLIAITNLMRSLPTSALVAELQQLLPIILESLKVPLSAETAHSAPLQQAAVSTLKLLIKETPDIVTDHLNTVISALVTFATEQDKSPLSLRLEAVEVLNSISTLSYIRVQRFKQQVVRGLKPALDDRKRVVRRAAIKASNEWAVLASDTAA